MKARSMIQAATFLFLITTERIEQCMWSDLETMVKVRAKLPPGVDGWGYSLKGMMGMVVIGGLLITLTYFLTQRFVVPK